MKKIGLIITIIMLIMVTNVSAKEYSSNYFDYKYTSYVNDTLEGTGTGAFNTPIHTITSAYFTSSLTNKKDYLSIRLKLNEGMPEFVTYKVSVEVYGANKNLIKKYEGLETTKAGIYSIETFDIQEKNPKYYKVIFNYIDDFFLENDDYKNNDVIINEMETGIMANVLEYTNTNDCEGLFCSHFVLFETYHMYIKKGATFKRTIPKIYTNPETKERFKMILDKEYYDAKQYPNNITEDDNNYYYEVIDQMDSFSDRIIKPHTIELLFKIEPLDNTKVMMVPLFFNLPDVPTRKIKLIIDDEKNKYYKNSKIVTNDSINKIGYEEKEKEPNNFVRYNGKELALKSDYTFTKDDYIYKYYYNSGIANITDSSSNTTIIIIAIIVGIMILAVIAIILMKKTKRQNPSLQPNMMNRPLGNPNQTIPPQQGYGQPPMNPPYGQNNYNGNPNNRF